MGKFQWDKKLPKKLLIIDHDSVTSHSIRNFAKDLGIESITNCEDGTTAWQELSGNQYDFVVMGWKLSGTNAITLFNRIRQHKALSLKPVLVVSDEVKGDDFVLLQDYPCTKHLPKPVMIGQLNKCMQDLQNEYVWNLENRSLLESLLSDARKNPRKVKNKISQVLKKAPNPVPVALHVARILTDQRFFKQAEDLYQRIYKIDDQCLQAITGLGRIYYLTSRSDQALTYLRIAWRLSPKNIERLCLIGEVEATNQEFGSARGFFAKALEIDADDKKAQAGLDLCNNLEEYVTHNAAFRVGQNFASMCNTVGISLIRSEKMDEGIEQYKSALSFLGQGLLGGRVAFNLGLGYLRWGRLDLAKNWFAKSKEMIPSGFPKLDTYIRKTDEMLSGSDQSQSAATVTDDFVELNLSPQKGGREEQWFDEESIIAS